MWSDHIVTNGLIILTIFTICVSIVRNPNCALALLFSLITARLFSSSGDPHLHFNIMIFFAAICVFNVKNGHFYPLSMVDNEINYAVGYLYLLRMLAGLSCAMGFIGYELAWILSALMLALQNVLMLLGVSYGSSRAVNDYITNFRSRVGSLVLPSSRL